MEISPILKETILQVVDNQIKDNNPPETKQTYERLIKEGYSDSEARRLIGCVVVTEVFDMLKKKMPFDRERFVAALNRLPEISEK